VNLNSKTVRAILPLLALRPGEGHTLSELARYGSVDTKSVWQTLGQFRAEGAIVDSAYGRQTYSINPAYEFYPEVRVIAFRLLGIPRALAEAGETVDLAVLFGSIMRSVYRRDSDIDLLVVGRSERGVGAVVDRIADRLGKRIAVAFYTPDQFVARWTADDPFLVGVFAGPHAVLTGSFERLGLGAAE
jgi:predicted nucleotidyltransferase